MPAHLRGQTFKFVIEIYHECFFSCRRFDPNLRRIYNKIQSGDVGAVRTLRSISRDPPNMTNFDYLKISGRVHDLLV